ncbi:MAG TPA: hypothetical protein VFX59_14415 [Polyangiales bacterium]|nr:hypothetical protein [Polyangiales bacterium]
MRPVGWLRFAGFGLGCALLCLAVASMAPCVALDGRVAFAFAYVAVSAEILGLACLAPRRPRIMVAFLIVSGLVSLFALAQVRATPWSAAALTLALGAGVTLLGGAIGAAIERPAHLAAVGLVSAIADLWSVFDPGAPSAKLAAKALAEPERLSPFALPFPMLGTPLIPAVIGAGDVLFVALYVAAFRVHGLPTRRLLAALGLAFGLGLAVLLVSLRPIPLLPLLAAAVLACEPATRALERREWRTVLAVCAVMLAAIAFRSL